MQVNGDAWAAAFLASEPDYSAAGWIDAYRRSSLTASQI
jgi:hypothetical protein